MCGLLHCIRFPDSGFRVCSPHFFWLLASGSWLLSDMEQALRNRLTFGPLMLAGLFLLLWLDDSIQRWTRDWMQARYASENFRGGIGGVGILILLAIILP